MDIDVVASKGENLLVAECKFSNKKRTLKDIEDLLEDISIKAFNKYKNRAIYLFGSAGFDDKLTHCSIDCVNLVDLKTMFKV